jgi:lipopolysaccharide transport system permease protein
MIMSSPSNTENEKWDMVLNSNTHWWDLQLQDVWHYRDLLWMFVRRDFVSVYKQTILGPLWFFVQPILTTLIFTVIFSGLAKLPTDGLPPMLFYLAGITPWNYFSTSHGSSRPFPSSFPTSSSSPSSSSFFLGF